MMKLEMSQLAGALLVGTRLFTWVQAQGLEAALLCAALEFGLRGMRAGSRITRAVLR